MQELVEFIVFLLVLVLLSGFMLADIIHDYCKKHVDNCENEDELL